ncbi:reverse transcriptase domain-containing protein [Tanacetum coccineum]|uniref:Reverse transcriptase domain-containing protein n=1 Tax=Tanacetum coccineum TaxID=301880 RepID=A0ABQ5G7C2_9ASTR
MSDMTACLNDLGYIPLNTEQIEPTQGVIGKLTDSIFKEMLEFFQNVFPMAKGYKLLPSYYAIKKTFKTIGLGYESIHACVNDCFLFRGDANKDVHLCPVRNTSRWKDSNTPRKKVPKKVLCYFLIILRLQRLYKSSHSAKEMTWHATGKCTEPGKMQYPIDGRAWKDFDTKYPGFPTEPRNVRLGLAADGFNPFGNLSQSYNTWQVILTTYNLPPWLCMKESSFMLTLLIPDPKSPGKDIDVYLRPLIDNLKDLWAKPGVETIDVAIGLKFNMRAMVLWTINDLPARSSLSGWSGKGYRACPKCIEDTPSVYVMHIEKNVLESILNTLLMNDKSEDTAKARQDLKRLGIRTSLWLGQNKNKKCSKPQAAYSFKPEDKKKFCQFINGAKPKGSIAEGYVVEEALTFSSHYFWDGTTKFNRPNRNVDFPPPTPEIDTYQAKFNSEFPNKDMKEEFPGWFRKQIRQSHVDNDLGVSKSSELFALACGPSQTPISVNSCVVNGVRFVMHSRYERRTTQNRDICSPGPDGEMYYGQLEQILEFSYLSFKTVLFRVKWFDTSNKGQDDPDVIHVNNSSDLALSTSLNDMEITALHIDGQSIDVDAPLDIIDVVDEDDDIIDEEDPIPHDLADSDDEDLINLDIDDGVTMSADVARGHGGDGGGDDRPPSHQIPTGCGGCLGNRGKSTQKPNLAHLANYLGELVRELPLHHPSWCQVPPEQKAGVMAKIGTQFDIRPHMNLIAGHKSMRPSSSIYKRSTMARMLLLRKDGELSYSRVPVADPHLLLDTYCWRCILEPCGQSSIYEMLRLQGLGSNTSSGVPYTEDEIMAIVLGGKQRGHIPGVGRLFRSDVKFSQMLTLLESQPEYDGGSGSGGCGDDEPGDDEDGGKDEEDEDDS